MKFLKIKRHIFPVPTFSSDRKWKHMDFLALTHDVIGACAAVCACICTKKNCNKSKTKLHSKSHAT